jgi:hypothetical protein
MFFLGPGSTSQLLKNDQHTVPLSCSRERLLSHFICIYDKT